MADENNCRMQLANTLGVRKRELKRGFRACDRCRTRRVRCDRFDTGSVCVNCHLDATDCIWSERRAKPKARSLSATQASETVFDTNAEVTTNLSTNVDHGPENALELPAMGANISTASATNQRRCSTVRMSPSGPEHQRPNVVNLTPDSTHNELDKQSPRCLNPPRQACHMQTIPGTHNVVADLPSFIKAIDISQTPAADQQYLASKGALSLPGEELLNELLRSFCFYVHPFLPVLDIRNFLQATHAHRLEKPISLLVFHSVAFAASAMADEDVLLSAGFKSRKAARHHFHDCAEALYNLSIEDDRLAIAQSALLLTFWYETVNHPRDLWYWLNIGISMARSIGTDRIHADENLHLSTRRLFKRLWWSCYIRDTIISTSLRTMPLIRQDDFSVPPLQLDDYEVEATPSSLASLFPQWEPEFYPRRVFEMHMFLSRLCLIARQILASRYEVSVSKPGTTTECTVKLSAKLQINAGEIERLDRALLQWFETLPSYLMNSAEHRQYFGEMALKSLIVHGTVLKGAFYMATYALHLPEVITSRPSSTENLRLKPMAIQRVCMAVCNVISSLKEVDTQGCITLLPITIISLLLPSIVAQLSLTNSLDQNARLMTLERIEFLMGILERMKSTYPFAEIVSVFAAAVLERKGLSSLLNSGPSPQSPISDIEMGTDQVDIQAKWSTQPPVTQKALMSMTLTGFEHDFLQDLLVTNTSTLPVMADSQPLSLPGKAANMAPDSDTLAEANAEVSITTPSHLAPTTAADMSSGVAFGGIPDLPDAESWLDFLTYSPAGGRVGESRVFTPFV